MTRLELQISCVGSNRSTNWATTTAQSLQIFTAQCCLKRTNINKKWLGLAHVAHWSMGWPHTLTIHILILRTIATNVTRWLDYLVQNLPTYNTENIPKRITIFAKVGATSGKILNNPLRYGTRLFNFTRGRNFAKSGHTDRHSI